MRKKLPPSVAEMNSFANILELYSILEGRYTTHKELAKEIGISAHLLGRIVNKKAHNISWPTRIKIMQWVERIHLKKNTPVS